VFLLFGGVLADRLPRQRVMFVANLVQGTAQGVFGLLVLTGQAQVWEMMVLTAARGCGFGFYMPAAQGLVPQTVVAENLASANAVRRLSLNGAQIAGAALGGLVVAAAGPGWGLIADAASYGAAAVTRIGMRFTSLPPIVRVGLLPELLAGWRAFTSRRWLWVVVAEFGVVNAMFVGAFLVLGPVVAQDHLGGAWSWGLILAAQSVGAVTGAAVMVRWRPIRLLRTGNFAVAAMALPLAALAFPLALPVIAAAALLSGFGIETFEVNWTTAMQEHVPREMLSRVSAYDALGSYALSPIGTTLAGPVAAVLGNPATLGGAAVVILGATAIALAVPDVRQLSRRAQQPSSPAPVGAPSA
jgi:MFS family permease